MAIAMFVFTLIPLLLTLPAGPVTRWSLWALLGGFLAATAVHELIHAALFQLFGAKPKMRIQGMSLTTTAIGYLLTRKEEATVLLTPTIVILGSSVVCWFAPFNLKLFTLGAVPLTASGCLFDLIAASKVLRGHSNAWWMDTSTGLDAYV